MNAVRTQPDGRGVSARGGFTLIELMVVMLIIAALAGLLLPAIMGSINRARIADARAEISQIEGAIAAFAHEYGKEPPSSITLYESAAGWTTDPVNRARIRGLWSRFDFTYSAYGGQVDLNGNGATTDVIQLQGDQCLVFFLGGIYNPVSGFHGFSANSTNPFSTTGAQTTRKGPFFTFDPTRVRTSVIGVTYPTNSYLTRFPVYFDKLPGQTRPLIYASSYSGQGYNDDPNSDGTPNDGDLATPAVLAENPNGMFVYIQNVVPASGVIPAAYKPKGFQIISPGYDGKYGIGGPYLEDGNIQLPQRSAPLTFASNRVVERDNITNFTSGELVPTN